MKAVFTPYLTGTNEKPRFVWKWYFGTAASRHRYTRRSSAVRGFERFVRHISGKGKAS